MGQKYIKNAKNAIFGIFGVILPYFACGGVFVFCRGPSFSHEFIAFRLIQMLCPAKRAEPENHWKRELIPDRAYPAITSTELHKLVLGNLLPYLL